MVRHVPVQSTSLLINATENRGGYGLSVNEPIGGHDPYINSKGCAELVRGLLLVFFFSPMNTQSTKSRCCYTSLKCNWSAGTGRRTDLYPILPVAFCTEHLSISGILMQFGSVYRIEPAAI